MRRASVTGTSRFMSARRTLRATLAPDSQQTRATACLGGRSRVASTQDVAQAVRVAAEGIKLTAATAPARRKRQREPAR